MVTITVDGVDVQVDESKNLIDALKEQNIEVPHFCYHPELEVVGMCRICLIEIEGVPKLQAACNTPVKEGLKINVANEKVTKAREGVMEFLLINHPLDCPVCDKAGECDLQDYSFSVGGPTTRYEEKKRDIPQERIGTNMYINHNRCILCYRCVRFDRDVVGIHDLEFAARGNDTIIAYNPPANSGQTLLDHNYQGALADICPVGALLTEENMFKSRVWWYQQKQSICHGCSTGCRVTVDVKGNEVYRYMPPEKPEENGYFICDKGRFSIEQFAETRLYSYMLGGRQLKSAEVLPSVAGKFRSSEKVVMIGGATESIEDLDLIKKWVESSPAGKNITWDFRTEDYMFENRWEDKVDFLLSVDQRPNSAYAREINAISFSDKSEAEKALLSADMIIVVNEFSAPYVYNAENPETLKESGLYSFFENNNLWQKSVILSTHENEATAKAMAAFPVQTFVEKTGTYRNRKGEVNKAEQAVNPAPGLLATAATLEKFNGYLAEEKEAATVEG